MIIVHHPDGQEEATRYEFRPKRLPGTQAAEFQKLYRQLAGEPNALWEHIQSVECPAGDPTAKRLMLWYCQRLEHPALKLKDVDPIDEDLSVELDLPETQSLRTRIAAATNVNEDQRVMILEQLDADIERLGKSSEHDPDAVIDRALGRYAVDIAHLFHLEPVRIPAQPVESLLQFMSAIDDYRKKQAERG